MEYEPLGVSTSIVAPIAFAYIPDVESGLTSTTAATLSKVESSIYGPYWKPMVLDLTNYLDKSKWYNRELNNATFSTVFTLACQGSIFVSSDTVTVTAGTTVGAFTLAYEIMLYDSSPVELSSTPTVKDYIASHLGVPLPAQPVDQTFGDVYSSHSQSSAAAASSAAAVGRPSATPVVDNRGGWFSK